jgi:hypothetical protein
MKGQWRHQESVSAKNSSRQSQEESSSNHEAARSEVAHHGTGHATLQASDKQQQPLSRRRSSIALLRKVARTALNATVAFGTTGVQAAKKDRELVKAAVESEDYLGPGYESRPWRRPSVTLAKQRAAAGKFLNGKGPLLDTTLQQVEDLGVGVVIYFKLLHQVAWAFTIMSVLALPVILMNNAGTHVRDSDAMDAIQLLRFTLSNQNFVNLTTQAALYPSGNSITAVTEPMLEAIAQNRCPDCLIKAVAPWGGPPVVSANLMGQLCVGIDALYCLVFVALIPRLMRMISRSRTNVRQAVQASNYAVFVRGLPEDATEAQVCLHIYLQLLFTESIVVNCFNEAATCCIQCTVAAHTCLLQLHQHLEPVQ